MASNRRVLYAMIIGVLVVLNFGVPSSQMPPDLVDEGRVQGEEQYLPEGDPRRVAAGEAAAAANAVPATPAPKKTYGKVKFAKPTVSPPLPALADDPGGIQDDLGNPVTDAPRTPRPVVIVNEDSSSSSGGGADPTTAVQTAKPDADGADTSELQQCPLDVVRGAMQWSPNSGDGFFMSLLHTLARAPVGPIGSRPQPGIVVQVGTPLSLGIVPTVALSAAIRVPKFLSLFAPPTGPTTTKPVPVDDDTALLGDWLREDATNVANKGHCLTTKQHMDRWKHAGGDFHTVVDTFPDLLKHLPAGDTSAMSFLVVADGTNHGKATLQAVVDTLLAAGPSKAPQHILLMAIDNPATALKFATTARKADSWKATFQRHYGVVWYSPASRTMLFGAMAHLPAPNAAHGDLKSQSLVAQLGDEGEGFVLPPVKDVTEKESGAQNACLAAGKEVEATEHWLEYCSAVSLLRHRPLDAQFRFPLRLVASFAAQDDTDLPVAPMMPLLVALASSVHELSASGGVDPNNATVPVVRPEGTTRSVVVGGCHPTLFAAARMAVTEQKIRVAVNKANELGYCGTPAFREHLNYYREAGPGKDVGDVQTVVLSETLEMLRTDVVFAPVGWAHAFRDRLVGMKLLALVGPVATATALPPFFVGRGSKVPCRIVATIQVGVGLTVFRCPS